MHLWVDFRVVFTIRGVLFCSWTPYVQCGLGRQLQEEWGLLSVETKQKRAKQLFAVTDCLSLVVDYMSTPDLSTAHLK